MVHANNRGINKMFHMSFWAGDDEELNIILILWIITFVSAACSTVPLNSVDLSEYDIPVIAGALKKFLHEMPDPIIPVQWYDRFIEASSKYFANIHHFFPW